MNAARRLIVRRSTRARADLLDIWLYVAEHNAAAADRALDRIRHIVELLTDHPEIGRQRPELLPELRSFPVRPWIIFYRITDEALEIIRIVQGARDLISLDF